MAAAKMARIAMIKRIGPIAIPACDSKRLSDEWFFTATSKEVGLFCVVRMYIYRRRY
jgi:hypothetical protein